LSRVAIKELIWETRSAWERSKVFESGRYVEYQQGKNDRLELPGSIALSSGSLWLLCGLSQKGGRNLGVSIGGVSMISRFD
jgi:hypothetical protein